MISDNVFVATVYINELRGVFDYDFMNEATKQVYDLMTPEAKLEYRQQYENLAIAVNTGTNLPSVATPNGQAAFLFLLTSALAPLINLSYGKMVKMAFPYTIVLGGIGLLGILYIL